MSVFYKIGCKIRLFFVLAPKMGEKNFFAWALHNDISRIIFFCGIRLWHNSNLVDALVFDNEKQRN